MEEIVRSDSSAEIQVIGAKRFEVNSFLVNANQKLGLCSLLNLIQDAAWSHATHMGHGYEDSLSRKTFWILTKQKIFMNYWPVWGDTVEIKTWVRPIKGAVAYRDSAIFLNQKKIGEGATCWLLLNAETRRPIRGGMPDSAVRTRNEGALEFEIGKIPLRKDLKNLATFQIRNSDLDINDHVNNTRYAQWILDAVPFKWHKLFNLMEYQINFLSEVKSGETIQVRAAFGDRNSNPRDVQFQGYREKDDKVVFVAELKAREIQ